jgi:hypothetical protein
MGVLSFVVYDAAGQEAGKRIRTIEVSIDNLVGNGDFEVEELGWDVIYPEGGKWSYDDKVFKSGKRSLRLNPVNSGSPRYFFLQQYPPKPPAGKYIFEGWCRVSDDCNGVPSVSMNVAVPVPATPGKYENTNYSVRMPDNSPCNEWVKLSKEIIIPENAVMNVQLLAPGTRGAIWFDDLFLGRIGQ